MQNPITARKFGRIRGTETSAPAVLATPRSADAHQEGMNAMASIAIPLHSRKHPGLHALVDEQDAELVNQYRWNVQPGRNTFYAIAAVRVNGAQKTLRMHRVVSHAPDDRFVDHRDNNGLNNTKANLRICTNQQNLHNRITTSASRYVGVSWSKGSALRPWKAYIGLKGKPVYLGRFATEVDAAVAYDRAALTNFGETAALNFPDASKLSKAVGT